MEYKLSIGYSGTYEDLQKMLDITDKIGSVYTGGVAGKIAGGRPQYIEKINDLKESIKLAHANKVDFEIALNTPCGIEPKSNKIWWDDTKDYLERLENIGVDRVILSHPFMMELAKRYTNMQVVASTICEITSVRSALYYEMIGCDIIIPSMNANYSMDVLKDIKRSLKKSKIRLMMNEHCLGDCPWRRFHHNQYAHHNDEIDYHMKCKTLMLMNPSLLLTNNVIRPEDIKSYSGITDDIKLVGRLVPIDDLLNRIKAYSDGKFSGNYIELFDSNLSKNLYIDNEKLDSLFEHKTTCKKICEQCNYCKKLYEKSMKNKENGVC